MIFKSILIMFMILVSILIHVHHLLHTLLPADAVRVISRFIATNAPIIFQKQTETRGIQTQLIEVFSASRPLSSPSMLRQSLSKDYRGECQLRKL